MSPTQLEFLQIFGHSRSPSIEFRELTKKDAKVSDVNMNDYGAKLCGVFNIYCCLAAYFIDSDRLSLPGQNGKM